MLCGKQIELEKKWKGRDGGWHNFPIAIFSFFLTLKTSILFWRAMGQKKFYSLLSLYLDMAVCNNWA
jgi:hypothetical protein